jgi:hypothetical protein
MQQVSEARQLEWLSLGQPLQQQPLPFREHRWAGCSQDGERATPSRSDLSPPHAWVKVWLDHTGPDPEFRIRVSDLYCLPSCASARFFSTSASACLAVERSRRARRASAP